MTYLEETVITPKKDDQYVELESRINKMEVREVEDFKSFVNFPVTKCLMVEDGEYLAEVEKKVKAQESVKAAADHVTVSNDEDGVAVVVEQFILGE